MASIDQALSIAATLQNKVGQSFSAANSLLPPDDMHSTLLQAGAMGANTNVLGAIYQGQQRLYECTENIASLLKQQVDMAIDKDRKEREALAELEKEKLGGDGAVNDNIPTGTIPEGDMDGAGFNLGNLFSGALGAIFGAGGVIATGAASRFAKGLGKGLVRGGFYGLLASFLAKPLIEFVEDGILKIDIPETEKADMETAIMATAAGAGLFGKKGAFIALAGVGIKGVYDYMTGKSDDISKTEWGSLFAGLTGFAFTAGPVLTGAIKGMGAAGIVGKLGTAAFAISAGPFLLAAGLGLAAGAGAKYMADEAKEMRAYLLDHLDKLVQITNEEFAKQLKEEEISLKERIFGGGLVSLFGGEVSASEQIKQATVSGKEEFKDEGALTTDSSNVLVKTAEQFSALSLDDVKELLLDKDKFADTISSFQNLRDLAAQGAFGNESKPVLTKLLMFGDKLREASKELVAEGKAGQNFKIGVIARGQGNADFGNVDILEKIATFGGEQRLRDQENLIAETNATLAELRAERERIHVPGVFDTKEENILDKKIANVEYLLRIQEGEQKRLNTSFANLTGSVGFDYETLKKLYTDEELKKLFEKSMMTQAERVNEAFNNFKAMELAHGVNTNVQTDIKTNNQSIKQGDVITTSPNHHVDGHLQGAR